MIKLSTTSPCQIFVPRKTWMFLTNSDMVFALQSKFPMGNSTGQQYDIRCLPGSMPYATLWLPPLYLLYHISVSLDHQSTLNPFIGFRIQGWTVPSISVICWTAWPFQEMSMVAESILSNQWRSIYVNTDNLMHDLRHNMEHNDVEHNIDLSLIELWGHYLSSKTF